MRKDFRRWAHHCHQSAYVIKQEQDQILEEMHSIESILTANSNSEVTEEQKLVMLFFIQSHFKLDHFINFAEDADKYEKLAAARLHQFPKKRTLQYRANEAELDQLVDEARAVTLSYSQNSYSRRKWFFSIGFGLTTALCAMLFVAEVSICIPWLSWINLLKLVGWASPAGFFCNIALCSFMVYVVASTVFRVKVYKVFALHRGASSASSLLFTCINLARVCYPLCYNYLLLIGKPPCEFLNFFGTVILSSKHTVIFPIIMVVFAMGNIFNVYGKVLGYLGLSAYAFDQEEQEEHIEEGRAVLMERFKDRNIKNNELDMIQFI